MDDAVRSERELLMRFESLGGTGYGWEFAHFQARHGGDTDGLLCWADLSPDLLIQAVEQRFDGVGQRANTTVFHPDGSDEWWTRDSRYWMAQRTFVQAASVPQEQMIDESESRLVRLRDKLISDLHRGDKILVYKNSFRNLTAAEISRLHAAIRSYGDSTLFYIRYADQAHPVSGVAAPTPGLLIGYIDHFEFSPENAYIGLADARLLELCRRAWAVHTGAEAVIATPIEAEAPPEVAPVPSVATSGPRARRARHIVLFGNSQMQAMAQMYQRFAAGRTGDTVQYIESFKDLSDDGRDAIEHADLVVEQVLDLEPRADIDGITSAVPRAYIPLVTAGFLWPFAGQPHPKNSGPAFLPGGPYGAEAADSYLNRLILAGVPPDDAVDAYMSLDVGKRVNLERLFELVIDRQRSRDKATGYEMAEVIERHFRTEQVFLSPYHPNTRVAVALATRFFEQAGADRDDIDRMQRRTRVTPFPKSELPLHPAVCRHWGMDFVGPDRRYRFMNEGAFTFREYAMRYMRYEWNDKLEEGMSLAYAGNYRPAVESLYAGLEISSESAAGYDALGYSLNQVGLHDQALTAASRALELEPGNATYRCNLGDMLRERGRLEEAEAALRQAVCDDPAEPHYLMLLGHLLRRRGEHAGAAEAMRSAIALDPWAVTQRLDLAEVLMETGDWGGAADVLRAAAAIDPLNLEVRRRLARAEGNDGLAKARAAVAIDGSSVVSRLALSNCLLRLGRPEEALGQALIAAVGNPDSAAAYAHLGRVLQATDDGAAAEAAFRRAAAIDPGAGEAAQ